MRNIKNNVDLEWNVFVPDINKRQMKVFNIFNHISYKQEIVELLNHRDDYTLEEFREKLNYQLCIIIGVNANGKF